MPTERIDMKPHFAHLTPSERVVWNEIVRHARRTANVIGSRITFTGSTLRRYREEIGHLAFHRILVRVRGNAREAYQLLVDPREFDVIDIEERTHRDVEKDYFKIIDMILQGKFQHQGPGMYVALEKRISEEMPGLTARASARKLAMTKSERERTRSKPFEVIRSNCHNIAMCWPGLTRHEFVSVDKPVHKWQDRLKKADGCIRPFSAEQKLLADMMPLAIKVLQQKMSYPYGNILPPSVCMHLGLSIFETSTKTSQALFALKERGAVQKVGRVMTRNAFIREIIDVEVPQAEDTTSVPTPTYEEMHKMLLELFPSISDLETVTDMMRTKGVDEFLLTEEEMDRIRQGKAKPVVKKKPYIRKYTFTEEQSLLVDMILLAIKVLQQKMSYRFRKILPPVVAAALSGRFRTDPKRALDLYYNLGKMDIVTSVGTPMYRGARIRYMKDGPLPEPVGETNVQMPTYEEMHEMLLELFPSISDLETVTDKMLGVEEFLLTEEEMDVIRLRSNSVSSPGEGPGVELTLVEAGPDVPELIRPELVPLSDLLGAYDADILGNFKLDELVKAADSLPDLLDMIQKIIAKRKSAAQILELEAKRDEFQRQADKIEAQLKKLAAERLFLAGSDTVAA